jgi:hypothetical protein
MVIFCTYVSLTRDLLALQWFETARHYAGRKEKKKMKNEFSS